MSLAIEPNVETLFSHASLTMRLLFDEIQPESPRDAQWDDAW